MKDTDSKASPPFILAVAIGGFAVMDCIGRYRADRFKHKVLTTADKIRTGAETRAKQRRAQSGHCGFGAPPNCWPICPPS